MAVADKKDAGDQKLCYIAQWRVYEHLNRKSDRASSVEEMDILDPIK